MKMRESRRRPGLLLALVAFGAARSASAEREPVLKQIDVPHPYYYREMYLPQVTSGPSAAAWSPDGTRARLRDAGHAVAPEARLARGGPADRRPGLRLGARLVAGRAARSSTRRTATTRSSSGSSISATAAARALVANGAVNLDAALVARRHPRRLRLDRLSGALARLRPRRSPRARASGEPVRDHRGPRQRPAALLLLAASTSTSRRPGRPTARSSSSSPTAATSGAPAASGAWRRGPARRCAWSATRRRTGRRTPTGRATAAASSTARTSAASATSSG